MSTAEEQSSTPYVTTTVETPERTLGARHLWVCVAQIAQHGAPPRGGDGARHHDGEGDAPRRAQPREHLMCEG